MESDTDLQDRFRPPPRAHAASEAEPNDEASEAQVAQLVADYVDALNQGQEPDRGEYVDRFPALRGAVEDGLAAIDMIRGPSGEVPYVLDDFRVIREIGRGGMGIVHEAVQLSLGRRVALKVLPIHLVQEPKRVERFKMEARATARLQHSNIVPIYATGSAFGSYYHAMELVTGASLDRHIEGLRCCLRQGQDAKLAGEQLAESPTVVRPRDGDNPLKVASEGEQTPDEEEGLPRTTLDRGHYKACAELMLGVADALHYAHTEGVVHRDIKPSNLMLDATSGRLRVTDFGLAVFGTHGTALTGSMDIVGSMPYMAPEQTTPYIETDHRADVYSFGLTLYELVTLERAVKKVDDLSQILLKEPPPPRALDPGVPRDLETIILKAIEKDPDCRYQSAGALAEDLRRFLDDRPIRATRPSLVAQGWRLLRRHKWISMGTAAAIASICILAAFAIGVKAQMRGQDQLRRALALVEEGEYALYAKRPTRAVERFTRSLSLAPNSPHALFCRGSAHFQQKCYQDAIADYALAIAQSPCAGFYEARADAYDALGDRASSEADRSAARRLEPTSATGHFYVAEARRAAGDYEQAAAHYGRALDLDPKHLYSHFGRAFCRQQLGEPAKAITDYAVFIMLRPNHSAAYCNLGEAWRSLGHFGESVRALNRALEIDEDMAAAYFNLGLTYGDLGEHQKAISMFHRALEIDGEDAAMLCGLGRALLEVDRFEEALTPFDKAAKLAPREIEAWCGLALTQTGLGQREKAIASYRKALRQEPENALLHAAIAGLYGEAEMAEDAITEYEKALKLDAGLAEAHLGMGEIYAKSDRPKAAYHLRAYLRCMGAHKPDLADALKIKELIAEMER